MNAVPLTRQQQRIWLQQVVDPQSAAYNVGTALRFTGALDVDALRTAWAAVVTRHEALRAQLAVAARGALLEVVAADAVPLTVRAAAAPEGVEALVLDVGSNAFGLGEPLVRAELLDLAPAERLLVITADHIVFDGWSGSIVVEELLAAYAGEPLPDGPAPTLAELHALDATASSESLRDRALVYWSERLRDAPYVSLPHDRPRPAARSHAAGRARTTLAGGALDAVAALAAANRTTPSTVVLTAFAVLLARVAGEGDLVVGMPVVDRQFRTTERAVGFLTTTLPVRLDARPERPFGATLADAVVRTREAYAHGSVAFDEIVAAVAPPREVGRNPLFGAWFNVVPTPLLRALPDVEVEDVTPPTLAALFDVGLYCRFERGRAELTLVLDDELFEPWRAGALLAALTSLLEQCVAAPDAPAGAHALPAPTRPRAAVRPDAPGLVEQIEQVAAERVAVAAPDVELSYGALLERARGVAWALAEAGVAPGDVVALRGKRSAALVVGILGAIGAGATLLLLDRDGLAERVAEYEERADARLVLDDDALPSAGRRTAWPANPAAAAYVVVTSGSTGRPHAVRGRFDAVANFLAWHRDRFGLNADDRFALVSGIGHDPVFRDVLAPLVLGARLDVPAGELTTALRTARTTVLHATPPVVRLLCAAAGSEPLPDLRRVFFGGDVLTGADVEQARALAPNALLVNFYGTTETPQAVSSLVVHDPAAPAAVAPPPLRVPIGPGVAGSELLVLNPVGGPAGIGELGELHVRGRFLADGYVGEPALTGSRFTAVDGVRSYATGDLARPRPDGSFDLAGRRDRQHKVRGYRVESAEIERHLRRHPGVADAWATVLRDGRDERVVAYAVAADPAAAPAAEDVRAFAAGALPAYMVPARIAVVDRLPTTPNGKVDPGPLRPVAAPAAPVNGAAAAADELVREAWRSVLGSAAVDSDTNFFDQGGSSLALIAVKEQLERRLEREIPLLLLFEHTTIHALAAALGGEGGDGSRATPRDATRQRRLEASRRRAEARRMY